MTTRIDAALADRRDRIRALAADGVQRHATVYKDRVSGRWCVRLRLADNVVQALPGSFEAALVWAVRYTHDAGRAQNTICSMSDDIQSHM